MIPLGRCLFDESTLSLKMMEELASINSLCGTTTGKNILKDIEKTLIEDNPKWSH